jgi:serine/threonine protein kinase
MGLVYKAQDTKLGRLVALKFLPPDSVVSPEALERFQREARAASSLNHPAICTIYDVDEHQDHPYIAMELLKGQTLRERLASGTDAGAPLSADLVIDLALQIADALEAAHAQGIVHRDIKPANIFLTERGQAKLLDFGLAKVARKRRFLELAGGGEAQYSEASEQMLTSPGVMLGTVAYMSPEQVRGEELDARTDLFSLGAVLYEMATGRHPFQGSTAGVTFHLILSATPIAASQANPKLPRELERIINKALHKNKQARYQHASEIRADLERLKRERASGALEQAVLHISPPERAWWRWRDLPSWKWALGAALFSAFLLLAGLRSYRNSITPTPSKSQWLPLTDFADYAVQPSLSPDSQMLTFIRGPDAFASSGEIYVKRLPDGEARQLTWDGKRKMSPLFSPDGSEIAYTVPIVWDTWIVPVLGGPPRLLLRNASGLTWIGGQHLLFSQIDRGSHMCVVTTTKSRLDGRTVYAPPDGDTGMAHRSYLSPDGQWVLVAEMAGAAGWLPCRLLPFDGSSRGRAVGPPDAACTSGAWSSDGRWMFLNTNAGGGFHIWRQRFPAGQPEQFTSGPTEEEGIAMARDGHSLVTSVGLTQGTVWLHDPSGDRQISSEGYAFLPDIDYNLGRSVFSPDGTKLYYAVKRGTPPGTLSELWMANLKTGHNDRVLPSFQFASYDISPDGERIVFSALNAEKKFRIWLAPLNAHAPPHQVSSSSESDIRPIYAANGELFFQASESGNYFIDRMREDGTERRRVVPNPVNQLQSVSPDGQWVIAITAVSGEERTRAVVAFSTRDASIRRVCRGVCWAVWSQDGTLFNVTWPEKGTFAIPLRHGETFPPISASGITSEADLRALKGVRVNEADSMLPPASSNVYFAPNSTSYAFSRQTVRRNIYRIPIP